MRVCVCMRRSVAFFCTRVHGHFSVHVYMVCIGIYKGSQRKVPHFEANVGSVLFSAAGFGNAARPKTKMLISPLRH